MKSPERPATSTHGASFNKVPAVGHPLSLPISTAFQGVYVEIV